MFRRRRLSDDERQRLREQILEKYRGGERQEPLIVTGLIAGVVPIGKPDELQWPDVTKDD